MDDPPSNPEHAAIRTALAAIEADHPGWHCWEAVIAGILYARRMMTSPPVVVRAVTAKQLRAEVEKVEKCMQR